MTGVPVPNSDHVVHYCSPSNVDKEEGLPTARAFFPRDHGKYLSVNWLEYLKKPDIDSAVACVRPVLAKKIMLRSNGRLAVLNVGQVKSAARAAGNTALDFEHRPEPNDESHAVLTGYSSGDIAVGLALQSLVRIEHMHQAVT